MTEETHSRCDAIRTSLGLIESIVEAAVDKVDSMKAAADAGRVPDTALEAEVNAAVRVVHDSVVDTLAGLGLRYGITLNSGAIQRRREQLGNRAVPRGGR